MTRDTFKAKGEPSTEPEDMTDWDNYKPSEPWIVNLVDKTEAGYYKAQIAPVGKVAIGYAWGSDKEEVIKNARLMATGKEAHELIQRLWSFIENGTDSDDFFELRSEVRNYYGNVSGR